MVLGAQALAEGSLGEGRRAVRLPPLLPYNAFAFHSPLSPSEARARIASHLVAPRFWDLAAKGEEDVFVGRLTPDGFKVHRRIGYRNSFLPVVVGEFGSAPSGTRIRIVMRLHAFIIGILAVWFFLPVTVTAALLFTHSFLAALAALAMVIAAYALAMGGFWFEAYKQERTLREIFGAET